VPIATIEVLDRPEASTMTAQISLEPVWQKLDEDRALTKAEHDRLRGDLERLRNDLNGLGKKTDDVQILQTALLLRVGTLESTKPTVDSISWSTNFVKWAVGFAVTGAIAFSTWLWTIQSNIKDVHSDVTAAATAVTSASKLQDERYATQIRQMDELGKELQLRRLEIKDLSKQITDAQLQQRKP